MPLTLAQIHALLPDNTAGDITPEDMRDVAEALYDWVPPVEKYKAGRLPGETAHADDDFFSTYSGYTEHAASGTAVWAATRAGLTCVFDDQAASELAVAVKPVPAAGLPITIETQMLSPFRYENNPMGGLIFTDGAADGSNHAGFQLAMVQNASQGLDWSLIQRSIGTLASLSATQETGHFLHQLDSLFWRLIWVSANTFTWGYSRDSETWIYGADFSTTFTPTHMGFGVTSWGDNNPSMWGFSFLRVYEADLSV